MQSYEPLIEWYTRQRPLRVDLVGDYAGSELFLIDGDSLLRHVWTDERIDFDDGFQLLHAVYAVERFLEQVQRRRCQMHIAFFEAHQKLCVPPCAKAENVYKYELARKIVKLHLKQVDSKLVWQFESMKDQGFAEYLEVQRPLFIMAHDGEEKEATHGKAKVQPQLKNDKISAASAGWDESSSEDDDSIQSETVSYPGNGSETTGISDHDMPEDGVMKQPNLAPAAIQLKGLIWNIAQIGYNVALVNNVEFVDSKIFTGVLESHRGPSIDVPEGTVPPPIAPYDHYSSPSLKSQRERLAVATLSALKPEDTSWASTFLLHIALLHYLSLPERYVPKRISANDFVLGSFMKTVACVSTELLESDAVEFDGAENLDLCDYMDGRLLLQLLQKADMPYIKLEDRVLEKHRVLSEEVERLSGLTLPSVSELSLASMEQQSVISHPALHPPAILPFSNPVFDPHLQSVKLAVDIAPDPDAGNAIVVSHPARYTETHHWHNASKPLVATQTKPKKPTLGGKGQSDDRWERRQAGKARKWEQIYSSQMNQYAASLTDSVGGMLEPKLVITENKAEKIASEKKAQKAAVSGKKENAKQAKKEKPEKKESGKSAGKGEKAGKKGSAKAGPLAKPSRTDMLAQHAKTLAVKEASKLQSQWTTVRKELEVSSDLEARLNRLDNLLRQMQKRVPTEAQDTHEAHYIEVEAILYKITLLRGLWIEFCSTGNKKLGYPVAATLFDEARRVLTKRGLTQKALALIQTLFSEFGIKMPPAPPEPLSDRKMSFEAKWATVSGKDVSLGMSSETFQLLHCGELMDRDMDSAKDDRVSGFLPDRWQREVLDELDKENSVFVVAPTSAGKTFISFYAMDKVLRGSDDGILVYVAPTKALVNQIAAEVIARFTKNYRYAGKTVWAIHTRDYRMNNPNECQILVTVPHILQIMLLSPTNAKNWAPRIKCIIFDEVHSIGNADDGVVWEQLLLLAPCSIIALSATVGSIDEFSSWLANAHKDMKTITWPHRYSDLRKFIYVPGSLKPASRFSGLVKSNPFGLLDAQDGIFPIHPIAALDEFSVAIPDDLALEPRDCYTLYWAMHKHQTKQYPLSEALDPKNVFGERGAIIKKADVLRWDVQLKQVLGSWMRSGDSPFSEVVRELRGNNFDLVNKLTDPGNITAIGQDSYEEQDDFAGESLYVKQTTLSLLRSLHAANALPAILFSFDRHMCEAICKVLCFQLQNAETEYRNNDPRWAAKVQAWEAHQKAKSRGPPKASKSKGKLQDGEPSKNERMIDDGEKDTSWLDLFDPEAPSPEFSFADPKRYSKEELDKDLFNLKQRWGIPDYLIKAFERGIGVHHAGMNRKYRQQIEMLFRKGFLRVIISTGTLALGINAPCKTTVFAGDSVFLTALNYRQASGRAGRRGFDMIGNVVFHGFPVSKAHRLITSKLPTIQGHFPITTSLVLRLFILLDNSKQSEFAKSSVNNLLTQSRIVMGGDAFREQVLHHLRFSIEYMRRQKLLSADGTPLNFAGLVTHLYYTEGSAFAFHALLVSGYLEQLAKDVEEKPQTTAMSLMLIIAHIFQRRAPRAGFRSLPPMPAAAAAILRNQNAETLDTYIAYTKTYSQEYCSEADNMLPYSRRTCGGHGLLSAKDAPHLLARSAFVALSGHGDSFASVVDLATSVRGGVFLESASVPYLPVDDEPPNGWLYEFYRSGDVRKMIEEYGIRSAELWFVLKDVSLVLATIVTGLSCFLRDGPGKYFDMDETVGGEEGELEWVPDEEEEEDEEVLNASSAAGLARLLKGFIIARKNFEEKYKKMWA